ncbi:hypothetical protein PoB_003498900 [Plakobranchus ocellatus]|uniref:Uncharacterized protein n=1 Tax=Plakobranchus ocellatus TaxID=259542 RepID=A0AAV4AQ80_9GAST|nr:hypothetical protein PoB_003498900 [Plakobranchus ocellatus]
MKNVIFIIRKGVSDNKYENGAVDMWFIRRTQHPATSPQQGDLRLSGPPSGQGAGSGARTRDRRVPADLRADSQATVLPTPRQAMQG